MIRATLDVNVLASGFPAERGTPSALIDLWAERAFELVISEHILQGLARAWSKPYFLSRYRADQAERAIDLLHADATIVTPVTTVHGVGEDDEDDLVLATVIAGSADYLVTGDRRLQAVGAYEGLAIVSPRQFHEWLRANLP